MDDSVYIVTIIEESADGCEEYQVLCRSHDELTNLMQQYDKERYTVTHVELLNGFVDDYKQFIPESNLEFGGD